MSDLTCFEQAVMKKLLRGEDEVLSILREQLNVVEVSNRELTGAGFYTTLSVLPEAQSILGNPSFKLGDVIARIQGLKLGAGFLLYVQEGVLHMLEGYTYDEPWPQFISLYELSYTNVDERDMDSLRKILSGRLSGSEQVNE